MTSSITEEERVAVLEEMGLTDADIEAGARFSPQLDPDDPRWVLITIRQPLMPGQIVLPPCEGVEAQWRLMKFSLAQARGVIDMLASLLPVALTSQLQLHQLSEGIDQVGGVVHQMDENRKAEMQAAHEQFEKQAVEEAAKDTTACDPPDACSTHGRCWTHSDWEEKQEGDDE